MKEKIGGGILLTIICLFTGNWIAAFLTIPFLVLGNKYFIPVVNDLVAGNWTFDGFMNILGKDDRLLFGSVVSLMMYLMIIWNIIEGLVVSFGFWSILLTTVYLIIPIIKLVLKSKNKQK